MWMEELPNGKYKYFERYKDPYTEKYRKVSVTLNSKSNQAKKQAAQELHEKIEERSKKPKSKPISFKEALEMFEPTYEKRVKRSSFLSFQSIKKAVLNLIGEDTLIKNIDKPFLVKKVESMYYDDQYSFNYVKKTKAFTLMILDNAKSEGYQITVPNFKLKLNLRQNEDVQKYLEKEELRKIITVLKSNPKNSRKADMAEFMALTGLRYGELIALREEDLYEGYIKVTGTIDFRNGVYSKVIRTTPKTKAANRNIALTNRAIEIIIFTLQENQILKHSSNYDDQGYIFTNKKGLPIDYRTFGPVLKHATQKAKVEKNVTTHYFRHTHISFLAELNVPIKAVMERVGHTDASVTLEIYTHVTNKMKAELISKLETIDY